VLQLKNEQRKQYSYLEDSSHNNGDFFWPTVYHSTRSFMRGFSIKGAIEVNRKILQLKYNANNSWK
jgi:hypothetical protein